MNGDVHENSNYGTLFNRNDSEAQYNQSRNRKEEFVEDLEDSMPGVIPTISNQVSNHVALANGHLRGKQSTQNGQVQNGRPPNFRAMLEDAEIDSHI